MKRIKSLWRRHAGFILAGALLLAALAWLLLYKLPGLVGGLSSGEITSATAPVGWHGIYHNPLYLPLKLLRSAVFTVAPDHGQLLTRLPNVIFGGLSVAAFGWLVWLWHGPRTALLTTVLFAASAWSLHVSRLASYDVLYLWAIPTLLVIQALMHRHGEKAAVWYGGLLTWGAMLYIPGLIWLVLLQIFSQRKLLKKAWSGFAGWRRRGLSALAVIIWLPLLVIDFTRPGQFRLWAGLPANFASLPHIAKQFLEVFGHLFIGGPQNPELWLGRAPLLDAFSLVCCGLGIYFYATHLKASRSRSLGLLFIAGVILVGLGGPVGLSILVPLLYVAAAAGIAYILHVWLRVFPHNPVARGLGIGLVSLAVGLSCAYNLRAYFVAWPHQPAVKAAFHYRR